MAIVSFIAFLFAATSFTAATFAHFSGSNALTIQLAALTIPALYVVANLVSFRSLNSGWRLLAKTASIATGFLNFAFLAALFCWPTIWLLRLSGLASTAATPAWILLALSQCIALYGWLNSARLHVTRYAVTLPQLPASWEGREVVLVSDIHIGVVRGVGFVERIVEQLHAIQPKAVFVPGDMFDGAKVDIVKSVAPWAKFSAPSGVYFVTGNHDEFTNPQPYFDALASVGFTVLHNEKVVVDGLQIVGIHHSDSHHAESYQEMLAETKIDPTQPSILLVHRPSHLAIAEKAGVSLQLSGHTHAGQFPLWSFLVRQIYGRFAYGLNRFDSLQIVTSSGAGSGGPPFRVGTRSEIVVLRLISSNSS